MSGGAGGGVGVGARARGVRLSVISMFRVKQTMHVNRQETLDRGRWWRFGGRGSGGGKVVFGVNRVVLRII